MADSLVQRIIPLSQDDLQTKFVSEGWPDKILMMDCQTVDKTITFDNWRTSTIIKRRTYYSQITRNRAVTREFTKDGTPVRIILQLEDDTGIYVYNGIPAILPHTTK